MTFRLCTAFITLGSLFAGSSASLAQQPGAGAAPVQVIQVPAGGTECFRDLLNEAGFDPIRTLRELSQDPRKTVLVVFGSTTWLDSSSDIVRDFLIRGGSLLVLSDRPSGTGLLNLFNASITPDRVRCNSKDECYRGDPDFPYVVPFILQLPNAQGAKPQAIFVGDAFLTGRVACNYPAAIRHGPPFFNVNYTIEELAGFPERSQFANGQAVQEKRDFFALGGSYGQGRYLLLADQSVFINLMIIRKSLNNMEFGRSVVSWLQQGGDGKRTKCLFVEDGRVETRFDELSGTPDIPWYVYLNYILDQKINPLIGEMEQKDVFNQALLKGFGYRPILRFVLFSLMGIVMFSGLRWMWNRRHRVDASVDLAAQVVGKIPPGGPLQQRHEALLACGSLYESFRQRVRERFLALNGGPEADGQPPLVEVDESLPDYRRMRGNVLQLWEYGFGSEAKAVKAGEWESLNLKLRQLVEDAREGLWRFEPRTHTTFA